MKHGWNIRIEADQQVGNPADMLRWIAAALDRGIESGDGLLNALSDGMERRLDTGLAHEQNMRQAWIVRTREDVEQESDEHRCDNCGQHFHEEDLINPIPDLQERLEPGSVVPSGACPLCGALCYPVKQPGRYQNAKQIADRINALTTEQPTGAHCPKCGLLATVQHYIGFLDGTTEWACSCGNVFRVQPTGDLFETFKNLIQGLLEGYDAGESPYTEPAKEAAESMARQLVQEVERHIASVVHAESITGEQKRYVSQLLDMCQDVLNNWESGDLASAVNEMQFAMDEVKAAFENGKPAEPIIVTVVVEGGMVQSVKVPAGIVVEVHDYDVDGCDEETLDTDKDGDKYICSEWLTDEQTDISDANVEGGRRVAEHEAEQERLSDPQFIKTCYWDANTDSSYEIDPTDPRIIKAKKDHDNLIELADGTWLRNHFDGRFHTDGDEGQRWSVVITGSYDHDGDLIEGKEIGYVRI